MTASIRGLELRTSAIPHVVAAADAITRNNSVVKCRRSVQRRDRRANDGAWLGCAAILQDDGDRVNAVELNGVNRHGERFTLSVPGAKLDPAPHHICVGDRAAGVLAARNTDRHLRHYW